MTSSPSQPFYSFHRERFLPRAFIYSRTLEYSRRGILNNQRRSKREKIETVSLRSKLLWILWVAVVNQVVWLIISRDFYFNEKLYQEKRNNTILSWNLNVYLNWVEIKHYFQLLEWIKVNFNTPRDRTRSFNLLLWNVSFPRRFIRDFENNLILNERF